MIDILSICFNIIGILYIISKEQGEKTKTSKWGRCCSLVTILFLLAICSKSMSGVKLGVRISLNIVIIGILHKLLYVSTVITAMIKGAIIYVLFKANQVILLFVSYGLGVLTHRADSKLALSFYLYILQLFAYYFMGKIILKMDVDKLLTDKTVKLAAGVLGVTTVIILVSTAYFIQIRNAFLLCMPFVFFISISIFFILWLYNKQLEQQKQKNLEEENIRLAAKIHKTKEIIPAVAKELKELDNKKLHTDTPHIKRLIKEIEDLHESHIKEKGSIAIGSPIDTGFQLLDRQLENYVVETSQKGIAFSINLRKKLTELSKETGILQGEIQQIIGDLMRNAIRSIERKKGKAGNILLCFGYVEAVHAYVLEVYDGGEPFPEHILQNIGTRGMSTDSTGHGLADIQEICSKYGGSLEIEVLDEKVYCKAVRIRITAESKL